ncbi:MAG: putative cobaltochelatase [Chloroflexota bacterium]
MPIVFPFTAIVGQDRMKRALILNAVSPGIGGVLIRGERGTAKSTAARALAALLPQVCIVKDCRFGCDPDRPTTWCTDCRGRAEDGEALPVSLIPTPFINLPVSATEDRVVGTLDIEKAIQKGERHFEPGILASANRGLLYIDEVNLLDDHVVDVLLDSAAMGMNIVEREGISFSHPSRFILVGTMNPEEGDLRPQLLDRFALSVDIRGIRDKRERVLIMERNLEFETNPEEFRQKWQSHEQSLSEQIEHARTLVEQVKYSRRDLLSIAALTASLNVDGHRADLVILKAARAQAAFDGRTSISDIDIALAAELALPHRMKRGPFEQTSITKEELQERIEQARNQAQSERETTTQPVEEKQYSGKKNATPEVIKEVQNNKVTKPIPQNVFETTTPEWWKGGEKVVVGDDFSPRPIETPLDKLTRKQGGRRSRTRTDRKRGRYILARPANGKTDDVAFDATIRAAAPFQRRRKKQRKDVAFAIRSNDIHRKVRVKKAANLVLFVVDASWSMAVAERMSATKGAIFSLLTDAYQRRDRVGLIVFQKDRATLILPPTNSVELAKKALKDIPVGGKTPLSAGLYLAHHVIRKDRLVHPDVLPLMILLTDGAGNVSMGSMSPQEETHHLAEKMAADHIRSIVVNMEHETFDQGLAQSLADHLKAPCYTLNELKAENLYRAVREEMEYQ